MEFSDDEMVVDGILVLRITGEVDLSSSARLRRRLDAALERDERFTVDLTSVTFFDSSGIKALDDAQTSARQAGRSLAVVCPPGRTRLVFEITGLQDHFDMYDTVDAAVRSQTTHE